MARLKMLVVLFCITGVSRACSSEEAGGGHDEVEPVDPVLTPNPNSPGPAAWNDPVEKPADGEAASRRATCGYSAGAMPAATQGISRPNGREIPIKTIVVA